MLVQVVNHEHKQQIYYSKYELHLLIYHLSVLCFLKLRRPNLGVSNYWGIFVILFCQEVEGLLRLLGQLPLANLLIHFQIAC